MIDLHTHSIFSDGDLPPAHLMAQAKQREITGVSLTDHNTLGGLTLARTAATEEGLTFLAGVEISTLWQGAAVHILGYGQHWDEPLLQQGLAVTRAGYKKRIEQMIALCHQAGYDKVSLADIAQRRATEAEPAFISYDVVKELMAKYDLPLSEARALTIEGGKFYIPYGDWAMSPQAAIELLHQAKGLAVLAHPGITGHEQGIAKMWQLIKEVVSQKIDGVEVYHHFHDEPLKKELAVYCQKNNLLITGGSDFHGPSHFDYLGKSGLSEADWEKLKRVLE